MMLDVSAYPNLDRITSVDRNMSTLFVTPPRRELASALESWAWLGLDRLEPVLVTAFGDVFFQAPEGILFLDTISGQLSLEAANMTELGAKLLSADGRSQYLMPELVAGARERGLTLAPGQLYDFKVPPVLGGAMDLESLQIADLGVKLHIAGEIHRQVKDLPAGTPIGPITIDGKLP